MDWENVGKALMETIHCTLKANLKTCSNYFSIIGEHFILMNLLPLTKEEGSYTYISKSRRGNRCKIPSTLKQ
jgi:hypothetical protein